MPLLSRRGLLLAVVSFAGMGLTAAPWTRAMAQCLPTPRQTEGPYYPPRKQLEAMLDKDNDLTHVRGQTGRAKGQMIYVMGQVRDEGCRPIMGAVIEIWQASENGRYHHPRDNGNTAPLDPHFQYWGKYVTERDGRYLFKTIKPGAYQAEPDWTRPPHIHFKITHPDFHELITQMYFAGDPYQAKDFILNKIPHAERERVIVSMEHPRSDYDRDAPLCRFDLTLRA
ncbi:MAG TPA: protocatechuate 3,4-dioxygenase [Nitrospiraceae bacterium]|nr:protocatechuate 3,4-dioxygenase [Nitrospiraceae bacterium]